MVWEKISSEIKIVYNHFVMALENLNHSPRRNKQHEIVHAILHHLKGVQEVFK